MGDKSCWCMPLQKWIFKDRMRITGETCIDYRCDSNNKVIESPLGGGCPNPSKSLVLDFEPWFSDLDQTHNFLRYSPSMPMIFEDVQISVFDTMPLETAFNVTYGDGMEGEVYDYNLNHTYAASDVYNFAVEVDVDWSLHLQIPVHMPLSAVNVTCSSQIYVIDDPGQRFVCTSFITGGSFLQLQWEVGGERRKPFKHSGIY